jgi:hypothetical protein
MLSLSGQDALAIYLDRQLIRPSSFAELRLMLLVRALSREHFRPLSDILSCFANQHRFQFPPTASLQRKCARCREHCALMQIVDAVSHVGVIAGSFALHTYLLGLGQTPQWQPTDIDVYIPAELSTYSKVIDKLQTKEAAAQMKFAAVYANLIDSPLYAINSPSYKMSTSCVDHTSILEYLDEILRPNMRPIPGWRWYHWDALLGSRTQIDDLAPIFDIKEVGVLRAIFETVDGARECSVNVIFTDMATVTGRSITDNFDLACCAFACRVSNETLQFDYRNVAHAAVAHKKMVLMPHAFRRFLDADEGYSIDKQLERIKKYASRGFEVDV